MNEQNQIELTIDDIANGLRIMDAAIERGGVFNANEMKDVVIVREKYLSVLVAFEEMQKAMAEESEEDEPAEETKE